MFKKNKKIAFFILFTLLFTLLNPLAPKALASTDGTDALIETFATYEEWDRNKVYYGGDMVTYKGVTYKAQWWTQGEEPGVAEVWRRVSEDNGEIQPWDRNKVYYGGDQVSHNGKIYKAQWWTQGEEPGIAAVWLLIGSGPNPTPTPTPGPQPSDLVNGGVYTITNKASGKVLNVEGQSTNDGAKIIQWINNNTANQQFKIELQADGYYKIIAMHSGLVLDVPYASTDDSVQLQQCYDNGSDAQRWQIIKVDGYYKVVSKASGKCMDVRNSSKENGAVVQQYRDNGTDAQRWTFTLVDGTNPTPTPTPNPSKFKVVGYYPSWQPGNTHKIQYNNLTHINYAFAIPTSDGGLLPLENPDLARQIIRDAHAHGVKVLLAVGGWSYNGTPLESTFMNATNTPEKIVRFGNAIIAMAKQYGFDGVDMDWEHPRNDGTSKQQYTDLMVYLSNQLHRDGMLLTSAVLSGVSPEGIVYWDAAAHTDEVINAVDWFNVMAYDGGDGERHSGYDFAINCAKYWRDTRHMPAHKVVLGVPFYGRPSWASYEQILQANPNAYNTDVSMINGMQAHYNGIPTITAKTSWACDNIGGIMIWELSQDTTDLSKSLLNAIGNTVRNKGKW